jgi:hypothetical protein
MLHSLLVHAYHLALAPYWRAPVAAFVVALVLRLALRRSAPAAAALAVMAGWLAVQVSAFSVLPARPVDRLPGLAVILLLYLWLSPRAGKRGAVLVLPLLALAAGWWMGGAPLAGPGLAGCVPIVFVVWAALAMVRRIAGSASGWSGIGAALALAGAITLAHGSPHWARAALVPAFAGLALIGVPGAVPPLAFATALTAAATVTASDQGRFIPVDVAVLAPLLVWLLAPRVLPRLNRAGPALAAAIATLGGVAVTLAAIRLLALR